MDFEAFVLNPATLLVIVFGLVEFVKQFGAKGNGFRLLSLGLGISMAVAFKVREMVQEWALWSELGFFGLPVGLAASGVYFSQNLVYFLIDNFYIPPHREANL